MLSLRALSFVASSSLALTCAGCFLTGGPIEADSSGGGAGSSTGGSSTGTDGGAGGMGGTTTTTTDPPSCTSAAECEDSNPCTADACPAGTCTHDPDPANEGVAQTDLDPQDCKLPVCHGGVLTNDADPNQLPAASPDVCSGPICNGTEPSSVPMNDGVLCGDQPPDLCMERKCSAGSCVLQIKPDGTVIEDAGNNIPAESGDCRDLVCQAGALADSPNFENCFDPGPGNCTVPTCDGQGICHVSPMSMPAPDGFPCTGGTCHADGGCY